jgi:hypothetical protein
MLKLIIETTNETLIQQIQSAYNEALETCSIESFVRCLDVNTNDNIIVGTTGSHIWISDKETCKRHAIIIR